VAARYVGKCLGMKLVRSGLHHGGATAECDDYYIQGGEEVVAILIGRESKVYQISTGSCSRGAVKECEY
jgi:hypothetical protein